MARSIIIKTRRLLIEPFSKKHLSKKYVSWLNNSKVTRYSRQRYHKHTLKSCQAYYRSFKGTPNFFWAIKVRENKLGHIGNITAHIDISNQLADLGILIGEIKAWGKGYAAEAWQAICNYLFHKVNIRKISAGSLAVNKPMLKLMKRAGMISDGRRKKHYLWEKQQIDVIYKAIFSPAKKDEKSRK